MVPHAAMQVILPFVALHSGDENQHVVLDFQSLVLLLHDLKELEVFFLLRSRISYNFLFLQNNIVFILFTIKRLSLLFPSHGRVFLFFPPPPPHPVYFPGF